MENKHIPKKFADWLDEYYKKYMLEKLAEEQRKRLEKNE